MASTQICNRVNAEIKIALEESKPYFLLAGHSDSGTRSPRQRWTISALNFGVSDRRGRRVFRSVVSIVDILDGALFLKVGCQQTTRSPERGPNI